MTGRILLDMTRAVGRRWRGATPSGIDRVCDAYAAHFAERALAVIQLRGHAAVLDEAGSRQLFDGLETGRGNFRALVTRLLALQPRSRMPVSESAGALYLNVGHSDFDLSSHWNWVRRRRRVRSVYLLHDLIPITHPALTTPHKSARHLGRVSGAIDHAAGVVMTTQAAARDLTQWAEAQGRRLPPVRIAPIAGGPLPQPLRVEPQAMPPFVSVGTIERRKNHGLLLRCWSMLIDRLGDDTPPLVLAGSAAKGQSLIETEFRRDPRLRHHVTLIDGLDDGALARLIAGARAMLLPTLAEGYGLPVVEALAMGVPVIASDLPALREVGQGVPALLDPTDPAAWAEAVIAMLDDGPEHRRQQSAMPQFRAPSWHEHFAIVEPWLAQLAGGDRAVADPRATGAMGQGGQMV